MAAGARATVGKTEGLYYIEYQIVDVVPCGVGIGGPASVTDFQTASVNALNAVLAFSESGEVWCDGSLRFNIGATAIGDYICMAVNLDLHLIWFRKNNGI